MAIQTGERQALDTYHPAKSRITEQMKDDHIHPLFARRLKPISGQVEIKIDREAYEKQQAQRRKVKAINPKKHNR